MGQKITPISLRLNKKKNWHSQWMVEKKNYANILHFDLEIRNYFETIFNNKDNKIMKIDIQKVSKNLYIYIYLQRSHRKKYILRKNNLMQQLNVLLGNQYNIKLFIVPIASKHLRLKKSIRFILNTFKNRFTLNYRFKKIIYVLTYALTTQNFNMISKLLKENLEKKKIQKGYLNFFNKVLILFFQSYSNFLGYKIQIKGRINGSKRSRKIKLQEGKIPLNTLKYNLQSTFDEFQTPAGICSLKIWFFFKNENTDSYISNRSKFRRYTQLNKITYKSIKFRLKQKFRKKKNKKFDSNKFFKNFKIKY